VRIQIPNRLIIGEVLHNSANEKLVELEVGVAYKSNTDQVISLIEQTLKTIKDIDQESAHCGHRQLWRQQYQFWCAILGTDGKTLPHSLRSQQSHP